MLRRFCDNGELVAGQVPLGGELRRSGYDIFDLVVSPLSFFDLWVQPHVRCRVRCARTRRTSPGRFPCHSLSFSRRSTETGLRAQAAHRAGVRGHPVRGLPAAQQPGRRAAAPEPPCALRSHHALLLRGRARQRSAAVPDAAAAELHNVALRAGL